MQIYKVYGGKVYSPEVTKETNCFYWFAEYQEAFGYSTRIEKEHACLTPQQAIQEALNGRRTMKGAFEDKLEKIKAEISNLERLKVEYQI